MYQAEELGQHFRGLPASLQPEVVVVSPLRRTLETAVGVFGGGAVLNGDAAASELLMVAMENVPEVRVWLNDSLYLKIKCTLSPTPQLAAGLIFGRRLKPGLNARQTST